MPLLDHNINTVHAMETLERSQKAPRLLLPAVRNMDHEMSSRNGDTIRPDAVIHMNGTKVAAEEGPVEHLMDMMSGRLLVYADEKCIIESVQYAYDYYIHP